MVRKLRAQTVFLQVISLWALQCSQHKPFEDSTSDITFTLKPTKGNSQDFF